MIEETQQTRNEQETAKIGTQMTHSEQETTEAGRRFASTLKPGNVVCLDGDLGAGKTAFARGIAGGLGITEPITSPSFTLVNSYAGVYRLHHFDAYRVDNEEELIAIGFEEYLEPDAVVLIEWAERIPGLIPDGAIHVRIECGMDLPDSRQIRIGFPSGTAQDCVGVR